MSDHTWTQEHAAAFAAGGLTADEAERLEGHVRDCPACAAAVSAARALDRGLGDLFAAERPGPALEDRAVRSFRDGRRRSRVLTGWPRRFAAGVAATVGLTLTGYAVTRLGGPDGLSLPGSRWLAVMPGGERVGGPEMVYAGSLRSDKDGRVVISPVSGLDVIDGAKDLTNEDIGLQSDLMSALPNIERQDKANVEGAVTQDTIGVPNTDKRIVTAFALPAVRGTSNQWFDSSGKPTPFLGYTAPPNGTVAWSADGSRRAVLNGRFYANPYYQGTQWGRVPAFDFADDFTRPPAAGPTGASGSGPVYFSPPALRPALSVQGQPPTDGKPAAPKPEAPVNPTNAVVVAPPTPGQPEKPAAPAAPDPARRVILRSGEIEFEVEAFDPAVAAVTRLVAAIPGGFVATVNSDKLANGKVKGAVTVRVPPEHLDGLVLDLRKELGKAGELKGQKIGSTDVTKQYTDLESRLRAARTMEQRLLQVIKEGKGEIKALIEAERELGVWRTKIEEAEGELRYYANLAALSTLTVTLAEREIRAAVGITESERVQAGVEVEDVDKAYQDALAAVAEAKGRVTKSELKQLAAGQFNATLHFEVAPEAAGPVRDRLRQLGRVARLEIDRVQQAEGTVPKDARVKRGDTVFLVQLYNLANVAPRETATLTVAAADVSTAYAALREAVGKAGGRVFTAQLNEGDRQNVTAQVDFEVKRPHEGEVAAALAAAGEVVSRQVTRTPESDTVTDTKLLYRATLLSAARLKPRETTTLAVEVEDVNATVAVFGAQAAEVKGRAVDSQVAHESNGRTTAKVVFEVPLAAASGLVERFKSAGVVRVYQSARDPHVPDTRFATARLEVTVSNADRIVGSNAGVWPQVRRGLSYSASVLLTSVTWVVFGLCVVLPWALVGYGGYRLVRRSRRSPPGVVAPTASGERE